MCRCDGWAEDEEDDDGLKEIVGPLPAKVERVDGREREATRKLLSVGLCLCGVGVVLVCWWGHGKRRVQGRLWGDDRPFLNSSCFISR